MIATNRESSGGARASATDSILVAGALACLAYFVLIGGGAVGELHPVPRAFTTLIAGTLIAAYLWRAPAGADRVDAGVLLGVLAFAGAALLSQFSRQSLDVLLGVLAYAAALFVARGILAEERSRLWFVRVLMGLSLFLTMFAVARWLPQIAAQSSIVDGVLPALNLDLPAAPWGHRYDLVLAIAMLYPAWWIGRPSAVRRMAAIAVGVLVLFVILITGSRTVWLAVSLASAILSVPLLRRAWQGASKARVPLISVAVVLTFGILVSGAGAALAQRAFSTETLSYRTAMWGPLIEAWTTEPLAGYGLGSFPWLLQLTPYFDTNSFAPRHPDNAIVQLLAEGGLLGVLALLIVVITILPAVFRGRSAAARWAIVAFIIACLGGNPSDFGFVVIIVIAWAAYAAPRAPHIVRERQTPHRPVRVATVSAFGIIAVASIAMNLASFSYESARAAVASGTLSVGRDALDRAVALDPGMALYPRQRGALAYVMGDFKSASADLERTTRLNSADDLAWRTLALAYLARGMNDAGLAALERATDLQRSDAQNLLLSAKVEGDEGQFSEATDLLAEVIQAWPAIVGAPGWKDLLPQSVTTEEAVDAAVTRWETGEPTPERHVDQALWLVALADRTDLEERAVAHAALGPILGRAMIEVTRCDPAAAQTLGRATETDLRNPLYPILQQRASHLALGVKATDPEDFTEETLNPLNENGYGSDIWGYRRLPISWPAGGDELPSPSVGLVRWTERQREAVLAADLDRRLHLCR